VSIDSFVLFDNRHLMAEYQQQTFEGQLPASIRVAVVVSRFNEDVTSRMLEGALQTLQEHGIDEERTTVVHVPGAFEIPLMADRLANSGRFDAVVCLGAVIQGETDHHDYINHAVSQALMDVGRESGIPVTFGVLTCRTLEQAQSRAGGTKGNKGSEAALAALQMASLLSRLDDSPPAG